MKRALCIAAFSVALAPALLAASPDRVFDIAAILSNTFEGSTPGNHLTLDLRPISVDPNHPHDLFLTVRGQFEKTNIQQQGMIRLEQQGNDIYFTYIPHFDATVTSLSADAGRFDEREVSSACSFTLAPRGDGFAGNTLGAATCALAMRGAVGKWSLELEPGNLRIRNVDSGETLRFAQVGKESRK
ncbi:MAG TPA: hypothetical protein VH854_10635 [Thermoanaerobaculia bacterium]|jgi:hypothetical protein|nr:hypothetical protein [Thermoanaerobaculia bacterium]